MKIKEFYGVKAWFAKKILIEDKIDGHVCFEDVTIINETDKCALVLLRTYNKDLQKMTGSFERWVPKKCMVPVKEYVEVEKPQIKKFYDGRDYHQKLVKLAKGANLPYIGLKTPQLLEELQRHGISVE